MYQLIETVLSRIIDISDHSLVHTTSRPAGETIRGRVLRTDAMRHRKCEQVAHSIVTAIADPQLFDTPGSQRLNHGVDTVDDHGARL
jgi:hypothetical protein